MRKAYSLGTSGSASLFGRSLSFYGVLCCSAMLSACSSTPATSNATPATDAAATKEVKSVTTAESPAKPLPDPCTLLTLADVTEATSTPFDAGKSTKMPPEFLGAKGTPLNCSYKNDRNQQVFLQIAQGSRPYDTQKAASRRANYGWPVGPHGN